MIRRKSIALIVMLILTFGVAVYYLGAYTLTDTYGNPSKATMILIEHLKVMLSRFKADCGRYPTSSEGLQALIKKPQELTCKDYRANGYLEVDGNHRFNFDAYGDSFIYKSDSETYEVRSKNCEGCFYYSEH